MVRAVRSLLLWPPPRSQRLFSPPAAAPRANLGTDLQILGTSLTPQLFLESQLMALLSVARYCCSVDTAAWRGGSSSSNWFVPTHPRLLPQVQFGWYWAALQTKSQRGCREFRIPAAFHMIPPSCDGTKINCLFFFFSPFFSLGSVTNSPCPCTWETLSGLSIPGVAHHHHNQEVQEIPEKRGRGLNSHPRVHPASPEPVSSLSKINN